MRELPDWHGDRCRGPDAVADAPGARAPESRRIEVLRDPEIRLAKQLEYRKKVDEAYAKHVAERLKPHESKPEQAPRETADKPVGKIAARREPPDSQEEKRRRPERSRLPPNETAQFAVGIGIALSSAADALNVMPGRWDAVAVSFLGAVVSGVAWGNKRWKGKHENRPED